MANYNAPSPQTQAEATRIARATQKPGQSKEQTRLIAQGIQKGIEEYKRQQKAKARDLSRYKKQQAKSRAKDEGTELSPPTEVVVIQRQHPLPWLLLAASWLGAGLWYLLG